jgi:hypothetical protein
MIGAAGYGLTVGVAGAGQEEAPRQRSADRRCFETRLDLPQRRENRLTQHPAKATDGEHCKPNPTGQALT